MDRKYNGRAWNKLVTTNIKNSFGLSFKKAHWLGHLQCVQDDCENFLCSTIHNETLWCGECTHIPILGRMIMIPSSSLLGCEFCHSPPIFVIDYGGWIYCVVHRLQSMSRIMIYLGVHNHLVTNGKWRESVKEIRRLIACLMQISFRFFLVLTRPSWQVTCLMILIMTHWSS